MNMLVNGEAIDNIKVLDRGLQYGDGLFETLTVINSECPLWERHMRRLATGCARLKLPMPDSAQLKAEAQQLLQGEQRAVLKIIYTRGQGERGYRINESTEPTRILIRNPWPMYPTESWRTGIKVHICNTRLARQPLLAGLKHLNRLEQVLARNEWRDDAIAEGLMLDDADNVIEGTMSNLFLVQDNRVLTPDLSSCGVAGIMREWLLEQANTFKLECEVRDIHVAELNNADEIFLSNSLIGVWPVSQLEDKPLALGPVTRKVMRSLTKEYPVIHA